MCNDLHVIDIRHPNANVKGQGGFGKIQISSYFLVLKVACYMCLLKAYADGDNRTRLVYLLVANFTLLVNITVRYSVSLVLCHKALLQNF